MSAANQSRLFTVCLILVSSLLSIIAWRLWNFSLLPVQAALPNQERQTPLHGYLWTSTIGWIKLWNQDSHGYGVAVAEDGSFVSGSYGWSPNVGWVAFSGDSRGGDNLDECPTRAWAKYDVSTRKFSGCAKVLSMKDQGWISLSGGQYQVTALGNGQPEDWGVHSNQNWGKLSNWGWSGCRFSDNSIKGCGLGWVSFNCNNQNSCQSANYQVSARPDSVNLQAELVLGSEGHKIKLSWNHPFGAYYYQVYRQNRQCNQGAKANQSCLSHKDCLGLCLASKKCSNDETVSCDSDSDCSGRCSKIVGGYRLLSDKKSLTATSFTDNVDPGETYQYVVNSCNLLACVSSQSVSRRASPLVVYNFKTAAVCSDPTQPEFAKVYLTWAGESLVDGFSIAYYQLEKCQSNSVGQCILSFNSVDDNITEPKYTDSLSDEARYQYFKYRLRAVSDSKECSISGTSCAADGDCSAEGEICQNLVSSWLESAAVRACLEESGYKEVQVK